MIRFFFVFSSVLFRASICYCQQVIVQPSAIAGIQIMGPQSPDYTAAVAQIVGSEQPPTLTAWLPYGVVVKNNSTQVVAGVCVVWTMALGTGPLGGAGGGCSSTQWYDSPSNELQPGQAALAIPPQILHKPRDLTPFLRGTGMLGNLPNYQRVQRLGISLDGVIFSSGQYVGSDTISEYEYLQANLTAPRKVAATLLEKKATGTIADIVNWLQSLDAQSRLGGADENARLCGSVARGMLNVYENKGEAGLYSLAEINLQQPVFPLHR
jgi:hypothetical protein